MKNLLVSVVFTCLCFSLLAQPELDLVKKKINIETITSNNENTKLLNEKSRYYTLTYVINPDSIYFFKVESVKDFDIQFKEETALLKTFKNWEHTARPFIYRPAKKDTLRIFLMHRNGSYDFTLKKAVLSAKAFSYTAKLSFEEKLKRLMYAARFNYANLNNGTKGIYADSSSNKGILINGFEGGTSENQLMQYATALTTKEAAVKEAKKLNDKINKMLNKLKDPIDLSLLNANDLNASYTAYEARYTFTAPQGTMGFSSKSAIKYYFKVKVGAYEVEDGKFAAILYINTKD